jgi:hypothetical protein
VPKLKKNLRLLYRKELYVTHEQLQDWSSFRYIYLIVHTVPEVV